MSDLYVFFDEFAFLQAKVRKYNLYYTLHGLLDKYDCEKNKPQVALKMNQSTNYLQSMR